MFLIEKQEFLAGGRAVQQRWPTGQQGGPADCTL